MKIRNFILMALPIALALLASCKDSKATPSCSTTRKNP